jgi:hypothetical protein
VSTQYVKRPKAVQHNTVWLNGKIMTFDASINSGKNSKGFPYHRLLSGKRVQALCVDVVCKSMVYVFISGAVLRAITL